MKRIFLAISVLGCLAVSAQIPDHIYHKNIRTVKLNKAGDIYSYPVLLLNSGEQLELHFDDLEADVKNYYYTFQLCNADWRPANIQSFDYIRGFQTNRITNYRYSSISYTPYTHYQAFLPERNSAPTRSGNYLLKVFLNDDTSKLAFTKRFLIVDNKASVAAQVQQPLGSDYFRTHQRIPVAVNTAAARINTFSPQDLKVVIVQNNICATASMMDRPSIFRGNYYEYYDDRAVNGIYEMEGFPATWNTISVKNISPNIFDWLNMQDTTRNVLIGFMVIVAVINLITCLLILVLERVRMIGILKAIGATDWTVQKIFLRHSALITIIGIVAGAAAGIGLLLLQQETGFLKLKEEAYYMSTAAVKIIWWQVGLICLGTLLICTLVMLIPSFLVRRIQPVKAIHFR